MSSFPIKLNERIEWCNASIADGAKVIRGEFQGEIIDKIMQVAKAIFAQVALMFVSSLSEFFPKDPAESHPLPSPASENSADSQEAVPVPAAAPEGERGILPLARQVVGGVVEVVVAQDQRVVREQALTRLTPMETFIINPTNEWVTNKVMMPALRSGTASTVRLVKHYTGRDLADPFSTSQFLTLIKKVECCAIFLGKRKAINVPFLKGCDASLISIARTVAQFARDGHTLIKSSKRIPQQVTHHIENGVIAPLGNSVRKYAQGIDNPFIGTAIELLVPVGQELVMGQVDNVQSQMEGWIEQNEKIVRTKVVAVTVDTVAYTAVSFLSCALITTGAYKLTECVVTPLLGQVASESITNYAPMVTTAVTVASIGLWIHSLIPVAKNLQALKNGLEQTFMSHPLQNDRSDSFLQKVGFERIDWED